MVKSEWERPLFGRILMVALRHLRTDAPAPLPAISVIDIGAGAGEGFQIARQVLRPRNDPVRYLYTAIDRSAALLNLAISHFDQELIQANAVQADMREFDYLSNPGNVYLSIGAPFSELTEAELVTTLAKILKAVSRSKDPAAAIVDVYGQYSLAWLPVASAERHYSMSFFENTPDPPSGKMVFYTPSRLQLLFQQALPRSLKHRVKEIYFLDRSIFTSRHTTTAEYNVHIPPLRTVLNEVLSGSFANIQQLHIPASALAGLDDIQRLYPRTADRISSHTARWNGAVKDLRSDASPATIVRLRELNHVADQHAIGMGHYLTMIALFTGAQTSVK